MLFQETFTDEETRGKDDVFNGGGGLAGEGGEGVRGTHNSYKRSWSLIVCLSSAH